MCVCVYVCVRVCVYIRFLLKRVIAITTAMTAGKWSTHHGQCYSVHAEIIFRVRMLTLGTELSVY